MIIIFINNIALPYRFVKEKGGIYFRRDSGPVDESLGGPRNTSLWRLVFSSSSIETIKGETQRAPADNSPEDRCSPRRFPDSRS
jgi:hypothetical protein